MHRVHGNAKTIARLVGLATPLLLAGCAPQSVTEQGAAIGRLYNLFLAVAAVVWVTVTGVMVCGRWCAIGARTAMTGCLVLQPHLLW